MGRLFFFVVAHFLKNICVANKSLLKTVIFAATMVKLLKLIGLLALVMLMQHTAEQTPGASMLEEECSSTDALVEQTFDLPRFPLLADAEPVGSGGLFRLSSSSFSSRTVIACKYSLLRECAFPTEYHVSHLYRCLEQLFPTITSFHPLPVCDYYIFALRRILI